MIWATSAFVALSIFLVLGAAALYSLSLGGRFSTKLAEAVLVSATAAPGFIALFLAAAEDGAEGIKRLLGPMLLWRVDIRWYLATGISTLVGVAAIELSVMQGYVFGEPLPELHRMWALQYLAVTLRNGLFGFWLMSFEMTGWVGYALPRLQRTHAALTSTLILGAGYAIMSQAPSLVGLPSWFIETPWAVPYVFGSAVLSTWIYNSTNGSLLLATLMANTLNTNFSLLSFLPGREVEIATVAIVLIAIMLIVRFGWTSLSVNSTRVQW